MDTDLTIDRSSTAERVAGALRAMMFRGELVAGEPLREIPLAQGFGVARSTVREALQVLVREGLLTRTPNRGAVVRELAAEDIDEIFTARRILETAGIRAGSAASQAAQHELDDSLAAYTLAGSGEDKVQASAAHVRFHNALVGLLDSSRLQEAAEGLTSDLRLALAAVGRIHRDAARQVAEHRRLLRLVRTDAERAVSELERHLHRAQRQLHSSRRNHGQAGQ